MTIYVVTVATDIKPSERILKSCQKNDIHLNIVGLGQEWKGFGMRFRLLKDWLLKRTDIKDDDYIVHTDAYDTICQKNMKDLEETIKDLNIGNKFFASCEIYLWPPEIFKHKKYFEELANIPKKHNPYDIYKFPCAGQYCAKKKTLIKYYTEVYTTDKADDQASMIRYIVKNPDKTILDRKTRLFQPNLFRLTDDSHAHSIIQVNKKFKPVLNYHLYFTPYRETIIIKNKITGNSACFLHANGPPNYYLDYLESGYIQPIKNANTQLFKKVFPIIEVISLPSRKDHVKNLLKAYNIQASIFDAVIGKDLRKDHPEFKAGKLSDGERGCALSHLNILKKYEKSSAPWVVILEDDFCVSNEFSGHWIGTVMIYFMEKLISCGKDWDIFYLGRCYDKCSTAEFPHNDTDLIIQTKNPACSHAYIVNTKSIPKLLKLLIPMSTAIDIEYINLIRHDKLQQYSSNPPLFFQGGFTTSITKRGNKVVKKPYFLPLYSDTKEEYLRKGHIYPLNLLSTILLTTLFSVVYILGMIFCKNKWIRLSISTCFIFVLLLIWIFCRDRYQYRNYMNLYTPPRKFEKNIDKNIQKILHMNQRNQ